MKSPLNPILNLGKSHEIMIKSPLNPHKSPSHPINSFIRWMEEILHQLVDVLPPHNPNIYSG